MASDLSALSDLSEKGRVISGKDSIYRVATPALLLIYILSLLKSTKAFIMVIWVAY